MNYEYKDHPRLNKFLYRYTNRYFSFWFISLKRVGTYPRQKNKEICEPPIYNTPGVQRAPDMDDLEPPPFKVG